MRDPQSGRTVLLILEAADTFMVYTSTVAAMQGESLPVERAAVTLVEDFDPVG